MCSLPGHGGPLLSPSLRGCCWPLPDGTSRSHTPWDRATATQRCSSAVRYRSTFRGSVYSVHTVVFAHCRVPWLCLSLCDITARLGSIAMQRHSTAPWQCPIACHCVSRSHELPDCYVILFGCYGTATHCYMLRVTELHMVATHPRFGACSWAQLAARMLVWLLCWSFEALAKGLELELGAESRTQPRQRWE